MQINHKSGIAFILFLLLNLVICNLPAKADTIFTHILTDDIEHMIEFGDSVDIFTDEQGVYTIENILADPNVKFEAVDDGARIEPPFVIWLRIKLVNSGKKMRDEYLTFCEVADSIWLYEVVDNEIKKAGVTGSSVKLTDKSVLSSNHHLPVSIDEGESKTFYVRAKFQTDAAAQHFTHLYIRPSRVLVWDLVMKYSWQYFYAGIMMLFSLLGFFMFGIFRDNAFIFFSMLMLFFIAYFLNANDAMSMFINTTDRSESVLLTGIITSGTLLFAFLFVSTYTSLSEQPHVYYKFYTTISIVISLFHVVSKMVLQDVYKILIYSNFATLTWLVLTIITLILLARKKSKPAIILLISVSVLVFSAILFIIGIISGEDPFGLMQYSFQYGTILFSGILFYGLFDKVNTIRKERRKAEELDQLKSRFFTNISHEFRTPLTLIMDPIRQELENPKEPKNKNLLHTALQNAKRLLQLINQMLDLSKLEAGKMKLQVQEQNFVSLLKGITMSFESLADTKNIRLQFVTQKEAIPLYMDKDKIEKIFNNLLSNAFKFTDEGGEVSVTVTDQKNSVEIQVKDTGIGIPASKLSYIFDRFFQMESTEIHKNEGSGIGLALVRELVNLHSGKIDVKSEEGQGTTFTIQLLKGSAHIKEEEIVTSELINSDMYSRDINSNSEHDLPIKADVTEDNTILGFKPSNQKASILIIEDNTDVRNYIKERLLSSFKISEASDGQEGIDRAFDIIPDLIISDVMMPKKNGYEVCKTLKTDQRTSHIPIVLLTAKGAQEEKLEGLETGADDYIIKPFDTKELEVRVRNLIELRRQLRKRNAQLDNIRSDSSQLNSVDKAFLENVFTTLETHLSDSQFGVDMLAKTIGMSRVNLNRKLRALTDHSTNKFIQSYRLSKAAELLKQKSGNVSEIAFQTGFSSTAYFVKCFRDKYGKTPGAIL